MMNSSARIDAVRRWIKRAEACDHPVDRFLAAWIALTIAAKRASTSSQPARRIQDYLLFHRGGVLELLHEQRFAEHKFFGPRELPPLVAPGTKVELLERAILEHKRGDTNPVGRLKRMAKLLVETESRLLLGTVAGESGVRLRFLTPFVLDMLRRCELPGNRSASE